MTLLLLLLALVFNLMAQALLKTAVLGTRFETINLAFFMKVFSNLYIWAGAVLYGASFLFYVMALSRGELSRISPISQALTTIGVVVLSVILFNEPLTMMKIVGLLLLIVGTVILFQ